MSKKRHSPEWILARVNEYLSGKGSYRSIARENGIQKYKAKWIA